MTPKEKAKELVDNFIPQTRVYHEVLGWENYILSAKICALIAVDEILKVVLFYNDSQAEVIYFKEVKTEIEKL
jgi:hypothetical protein